MIDDDVWIGANTVVTRNVRTGHGAVVAAGAVVAVGGVERLYCVEYSRPRLLRMAPRVLQHYRVPPEKVLCLGSFYDLKLPADSLDFVFLSQAFHDSDRPDARLAEMHRVLRPWGLAILIGEHVVPSLPTLYRRDVPCAVLARVVPHAIQRRVFGRLPARKPLLPTPAQLLAPNAQTGDYYRPGDYAEMFTRGGFSSDLILGESRQLLGYVLTTPAS